MSGHRAVVEEHIGRKLLRGESVHHVDGDHGNNDLANLVICSPLEHSTMHSKSASHLGIARVTLASCRKRQGFGFTAEDAEVLREAELRIVSECCKLVTSYVAHALKSLQKLREDGTA